MGLLQSLAVFATLLLPLVSSFVRVTINHRVLLTNGRGPAVGGIFPGQVPLQLSATSTDGSDGDDNDFSSWDPKAAPKLDFDEDYYAVLEVVEAVTPVDLKKAYFKVVFSYHPDRKVTPEDKRLANKQMMVINGAYRVLKDPESRVLYNAARRKGLVGAHAGVKGSGRNPSSSYSHSAPSSSSRGSSDSSSTTTTAGYEYDRYYQEQYNSRREGRRPRSRWQRIDDDKVMDDILGTSTKNTSYGSSVNFYDQRKPPGGSFAEAFARQDVAEPEADVIYWRGRMRRIRDMVGNIPSSGNSGSSSGRDGRDGTDVDGMAEWDNDMMEDFDDDSFIQGYDTSWTTSPRRRTQRVEDGFIFIEEDEEEDGEDGEGGEGGSEGKDVVSTVEEQLINGLFEKFKESSQSIDDFLGDAYDQLEKTTVKKGIEGEVTMALRTLLGLVAKKKGKDDISKD